MTAGRRRLRVLFVIDTARAQGGAERFATGLAVHMPRDRIEPWVCSTRRGEPAALEWLSEHQVTHIPLGRSSKWHSHKLWRLAALLRQERFDVVHGHMFGSNLWAAVLGRTCRIPVVLAHEHNWSFEGEPVRKLLDRHVVARLATRFITVSEATRQRMISLEHIPPEKVVVMPTAYIPHREPSNGEIRQELGIADSSPLIGTAAILREEKALDVLLDAHARLLEQRPDAHLVIAGGGIWRSRLEEHAVELGIGDAVHLLGLRRDVDGILGQLDVAAMSSDWEGMPLFVFECMAAAKPLVATRVGGLPEVIEDGRTGILVPPRDPDALAGALECVLADAELAARLASASAARLEQFRIETVAARFADLYEQLTDEVST